MLFRTIAPGEPWAAPEPQILPAAENKPSRDSINKGNLVKSLKSLENGTAS
jgi:hypothetical protein